MRISFFSVFFLFFLLPLCLFSSCAKPNAAGSSTIQTAGGSESPVKIPDDDANNLLADVLRRTEIPEDISRTIIGAAAGNPAFVLELLMCLEGDPYLRMLVDKSHPLPSGYEPGDLVELGSARATGTGAAGASSYRVSREGLMLRRAASDSLAEMAAAARADGVTLTVSSAYRSYDYQEQVYSRNVREMGREAADRESARPGFSQHQSGLVVDFGPIDNSFAEISAGKWMANNASRFGWSLSYPAGYEEVTGYIWESWHYRYTGSDLARFIDDYFNGIQQYALRFIFEWENLE